MPLQTLKRETADELVLEWVILIKNYRLILDKKRCVGCQICSLVCPKEAITTARQPVPQGEKALKPRVDIDVSKCNFCGACDILCPYGAINVTVDGKHLLPAVEKGSFPQIVRDIKIDSKKFPLIQIKNEDACPLGLISLHLSSPPEQSADNLEVLKEPEKSEASITVEVDSQHCPCCGYCEEKFPAGTINMGRLFEGKIAINGEKCPEGCTICMDVCPITEVLNLQNEDKKVYVNDKFCVYCGACKIACPVDEALLLKRTRVNHTVVRSGAWNKALERLTSATDMAKELKAKGSTRTRESVKKRIGLKEEKNV